MSASKVGWCTVVFGDKTGLASHCPRDSGIVVNHTEHTTLLNQEFDSSCKVSQPNLGPMIPKQGLPSSIWGKVAVPPLSCLATSTSNRSRTNATNVSTSRLAMNRPGQYVVPPPKRPEARISTQILSVEKAIRVERFWVLAKSSINEMQLAIRDQDFSAFTKPFAAQRDCVNHVSDRG